MKRVVVMMVILSVKILYLMKRAMFVIMVSSASMLLMHRCNCFQFSDEEGGGDDGDTIGQDFVLVMIL